MNLQERINAKKRESQIIAAAADKELERTSMDGKILSLTEPGAFINAGNGFRYTLVEGSDRNGPTYSFEPYGKAQEVEAVQQKQSNEVLNQKLEIAENARAAVDKLVQQIQDHNIDTETARKAVELLKELKKNEMTSLSEKIKIPLQEAITDLKSEVKDPDRIEAILEPFYQVLL